jgi:hypothetical protein
VRPYVSRGPVSILRFGSPGSGASTGRRLPLARQRRECHAIHASGANRATIECHRCHRSNPSRPAMMRMPALVANSRRLVATGRIDPTGKAPRLSPSSCRSVAVRWSCSDTSEAAPCAGRSLEGSATDRIVVNLELRLKSDTAYPREGRVPYQAEILRRRAAPGKGMAPSGSRASRCPIRRRGGVAVRGATALLRTLRLALERRGDRAWLCAPVRPRSRIGADVHAPSSRR